MQEYSSFDEQLATEGHIMTVLHGNSMWPMIRSMKDPVMIEALRMVHPNTLCRKGEVVAFKDRDRYVVHRIIKVTPTHYITQGDNCSVKEIVPHENVMGVVRHWWREGKMHSTTGLLYKVYTILWPILKKLPKVKKS